MAKPPFRVTPTLGPGLGQTSDQYYWDTIANPTGEGEHSYQLGTRVVGSNGQEYIHIAAAENLPEGARVNINAATWLATANVSGSHVALAPVPAGATFQARRFSDALSLPVFTALASSTALAPYERMTPDRSWSWHMNDGVLHDTVSDRTYLASQSMVNGSQRIDSYDTAGVHQAETVVNDNVATNFIPDDHNAPALRIFNGRLYVGYAGHNDDNNVYVKRSSDTTPGNLEASPQVIDNQALTTYAQFVELGGKLYVASRSGVDEWRMYELDEGAGTWSFKNTISTSASLTYINLRASDTALRYVAWDHPINPSPQRGQIKVREFQPADASETLASLTAIYTPAAGKSTRVLSITPDGGAILFAEFTVGTYTGQTYHVLRYDGGGYENAGNWSKDDVGTNDYAFYEASNYVPGGCFGDRSGDVLWLCEAQSNGQTTLSYGTRSGGTWSFTDLATSGTPLSRPITDPATSGQVWVQRLEDYTGFRDADIDSYVFFSGDSGIVNGDFSAPRRRSSG